jgi:Ni,Fe-hydrogenase I cytochrome b subunit
MKHNNTFTFIVIAIVIVIALFALYKSTSAPDINAPIDVVITENIETKN